MSEPRDLPESGTTVQPATVQPTHAEPAPTAAGESAPVQEAAPAQEAAEQEAAAQEDAPAAAPATTAAAAPPGRGGRLAALAAVLVVTVGLLAVTLVLLQRTRDAAEVASYYRPSSAPLTAARDAGRILFSYDHRTLDADFSDAERLTTGTFAKEYAETTQRVVRPVALENKAVVEASAVAQAVADAEPGRVVAIVFVNQVTTSTKVQGEKVDQSRVRMTLVQRGDEWLVSKVEAL